MLALKCIGTMGHRILLWKLWEGFCLQGHGAPKARRSGTRPPSSSVSAVSWSDLNESGILSSLPNMLLKRNLNTVPEQNEEMRLTDDWW